MWGPASLIVILLVNLFVAVVGLVLRQGEEKQRRIFAWSLNQYWFSDWSGFDWHNNLRTHVTDGTHYPVSTVP
jgi:hypothetical protein